MTAHAAGISAELLCDRCGYDLRAHPAEGKCPECGLPVAESRRWVGIPRRPAWRDSDPRWRRRMLAGTWILVLLPLIPALQTFGWTSGVNVPNVFGFRGAITLDETLLFSSGVYQPLIFCIGVVLLFSKEQGRRRGPLDWTRRWGVISSYIVLLLSAAEVLFIGALVMLGIAALFMSMPPKYQPGVTPLFVEVSTFWMHYGAQPTDPAGAVHVAFSSIAILLACKPLYDALRSSGPKRVATVLLVPLALFALIHITQASLGCFGVTAPTSRALSNYRVYFWPQPLFQYSQLPVRYIAGLPLPAGTWGSMIDAFFMEAAKWCIVLAIAIWLSVAQVAAWWRGTNDRHGR